MTTVEMINNMAPMPVIRRQNKPEYENPVNRNTERNLSILSVAGQSAVVGLAGAGLTSFVTKGWKAPAAIGALAASLTTLFLLPSKLYNTKVNAFAKEKEMDVFSRQKEAQANIYQDINKEVKDKDIDLDDKVNHYAKVAMADNGKGMMVTA